MLALVLVFLSQSVLQSNRMEGVAFYAHWVGAKAVAVEQTAAPLYTQEGRQRVAEAGLSAAKLDGHPQLVGAAVRGANTYGPGHVTVGTPFYYRISHLLSTQEYVYDVVRFQVLSNIGWLLACVLMCSAFGATEAVLGLVVLVCLSAYAPLAQDQAWAAQGRALVTLLGFVVAQWTATQRKHNVGSAGVLVALTVAYHPALVLVPMLLLIGELAGRRRDRAKRFGAGLLAGGVLAVLIGTVGYARLGDWWAWFGTLFDDNPIDSLARGSVALEVLSTELLGWRVPSLALPVAASAVALAVRFRAALVEPAPAVAFAVSLGAAAEILVSDRAATHSFVLMVPTLLYLLREGAAPRPQVLAVLGFGLTSSPAGTLATVFPMKLWNLLSAPHLTALTAHVGVLLMIAALLLDLRRPASSDPG